MLIPSYGVIEVELNISPEFVTLPDALFTLVSAAFALLWGYYVDKIDRARVIIAGGFCWSFGTLATAFSFNFEMLFLARMVTGAGMGCVLPAGYSILSDVIPEGERSGYFGNLAILSSIANGAGQGMSSFIAPLMGVGGWKFPFLIMSMISVGIMAMLFFIKFPKRGTREGELTALKNLNLDYNFAISTQDLKAIFKKRTNRNMAVAGFCAIIPGTVIIYYLTKVFRNYFFETLVVQAEKISTQTAAIFAAMVGIGYLLGNSLLGWTGDAVFKRNRRNRVRLGAVALILTIPACLIMLFAIQPISADFVARQGYPTDIPSNQVMPLVISTIGAIFKEYPSYYLFLIFAIVGSFFSAGAVANRTAVLIDVNLPEHRGTAVSFFNLAEQIGKGITLLIAGALIALIGIITTNPQAATHQMMIITIFMYVPTAIIWWRMQKTVSTDMDERSMVLRERQQMSVIDYIFEMEISLDGGLQKIHDARALIPNNLMQALDKISEADKIFENVSIVAENRNMEDVQEKANKFRSMSKEILTELQVVLRRHRDGTQSFAPDMTQIQMKIDEFPRSDLGKIEILYETGYLKVVEARLERKTNDVMALDDLESAIKIFDRVEHLIQERLDSQAYEGEEETPRALLRKAQRSEANTIKLRDDLQKVFDELHKAGIEFEDMRKMTDLTVEYNVPMQEVLNETLDVKRAEIIKAMSTEIDAIFTQYDQSEQINPQTRQGSNPQSR